MRPEHQAHARAERRVAAPRTAFDETRAEAFAAKMLDFLNGGALTLMISIGHRTALFDVMARMRPGSSLEIANAAGLDERYVREWLGAMVTGRIVDFDAGHGTYALPPEHAAFLARAAVPNNMAVTCQLVPLLGQVEDGILECFRTGGGLPYSAYPRFHEVMAEDSGQTVVAPLLDTILPLVPRALEGLRAGIRVLDVGCGSGHALNRMAEHFPRSVFVGCDISDEAIGRATREAAAKGLANVRFDVRDAADFGDDRFDFVTAFDAIHDQARPARVLKAIAAALTAEGTFLMQDIAGSSKLERNLDHPVGPLGYTISCMHCMSVSLAQGGPGLGAMWGEEKALEMLNDAGFARVEVRKLPHDILNSYFIANKA